MKFALIGHPLGHSFSRKYFTEKFAREQLDAVYENLDLERLCDRIPALKRNGEYGGYNVTTPYKREIIRYLDSLSGDARAVGAVNVIKQNADGTWKGYNTDSLAFSYSLGKFLEGEPAIEHALVFGNGGASQAVQYVLRKKNIGYTVVCRNPEPGSGAISYNVLGAALLQESRLLINTTVLGMWPDVETKPGIIYQAVTPKHLAFDLVYNPEVTAFMRSCAAGGAKVKNGLEMLYAQAEAAWRIWNGAEPGTPGF